MSTTSRSEVCRVCHRRTPYVPLLPGLMPGGEAATCPRCGGLVPPQQATRADWRRRAARYAAGALRPKRVDSAAPFRCRPVERKGAGVMWLSSRGERCFGVVETARPGDKVAVWISTGSSRVGRVQVDVARLEPIALSELPPPLPVVSARLRAGSWATA